MLAIYMAKYLSKEALLKYGVGLLVLGLVLSCVGFFVTGLVIPLESTNMMGNQYDGRQMMNQEKDSAETSESGSSSAEGFDPAL